MITTIMIFDTLIWPSSTFTNIVLITVSSCTIWFLNYVMFFSKRYRMFYIKVKWKFFTSESDISITLFGSNCLSCLTRDIKNKKPFSPAYGKMTVRLLVILFCPLIMLSLHIDPFCFIHNYCYKPVRISILFMEDFSRIF